MEQIKQQTGRGIPTGLAEAIRKILSESPNKRYKVKDLTQLLNGFDEKTVGPTLVRLANSPRQPVRRVKRGIYTYGGPKQQTSQAKPESNNSKEYLQLLVITKSKTGQLICLDEQSEKIYFVKKSQ